MLNSVRQIFKSHPESVGETYVEHAAFASGFGIRMVLCGVACFIHAIFPFLFVKTASACIRDLHGQISKGPRAAAEQVSDAAVSTSRS